MIAIGAPNLTHWWATAVFTCLCVAALGSLAGYQMSKALKQSIEWRIVWTVIFAVVGILIGVVLTLLWYHAAWIDYERHGGVR